MKNFSKIGGTIFLSILLTVNPVMVWGGTVYDYIDEELSSEAALSFFTSMNLILYYYMDNDLDTEILFNAAIHGMTEILDDYSEYMSFEQYDNFTAGLSASYSYFGITMTWNENENIVIDSVLQDSSAEELGVLPGDILLSAGGRSTAGMTPAQVSEMLYNYDEAEICLERKGEIFYLTLFRKEIQNITVTAPSLETLIAGDNAGEIGYIKINTIGEETYYELQQTVFQILNEGKRKLILDLRGNSGGYLEPAIDICRLFVSEGPIIYRKDSQGTIIVYESYKAMDLFEDIVVLVDEETASSGEIIASALQDGGYTVIGQNTFGKGVVQNIFSLSNGNMLKLTTGEYFRRSGEKINGIGVIPNIYVDIPAYLTEEWEPDELKGILNFLGFDGEERFEEQLGFINKIRLYYGYEEGTEIDDISIKAVNTRLYEKLQEGDPELYAAYQYYQSED